MLSGTAYTQSLPTRQKQHSTSLLSYIRSNSFSFFSYTNGCFLFDNWIPFCVKKQYRMIVSVAFLPKVCTGLQLFETLIAVRQTPSPCPCGDRLDDLHKMTHFRSQGFRLNAKDRGTSGRSRPKASTACYNRLLKQCAHIEDDKFCLKSSTSTVTHPIRSSHRCIR